MADNSESLHPGAQKKLKQKTWIRSPLVYLIAFTSLLSLFSMLQANIDFSEDRMFWSLELLDVKTAVTLLVAVISLSYTRNQFEHGYMPIIDYRIMQHSYSSLDFSVDARLDSVSACSLRNHNSVAIVTAVKYSIYARGDHIECDDYSELIRILESKGLINKIHYSLLFISEGWSLGENDERVIFEISTDFKDTGTDVSGIDIEVEFRSLLGDMYIKNIYCIPRLGVGI
ncbi:MAG: hypothetical protein ABJM11_20570 [Marinobacter sp.]|uniref:hypothetical protein n=1 Tax=Marinobacter sp. TaxID=50741 RepID=UPI003296FB87